MFFHVHLFLYVVMEVRECSLVLLGCSIVFDVVCAFWWRALSKKTIGKYLHMGGKSELFCGCKRIACERDLRESITGLLTRYGF